MNKPVRPQEFQEFSLESFGSQYVSNDRVVETPAKHVPSSQIGRLLQRFSFSRILLGGMVDDVKRIPRYMITIVLCVLSIWVPIAMYLNLAPAKYTSEISMILPGAGASTSVNLSDIGQASSSANSAYSSSSLSPTVTYKNLLLSGQVANRASQALGIPLSALPRPKVKLLDQTSFIDFAISGTSPEQAYDYANAVLVAFRAELDQLRADEIERRKNSTDQPIQLYQGRIDTIRKKIAELQNTSGLSSAAQYADIIGATERMKDRIAEVTASLELSNNLVQSLSDLLAISPHNAAIAIKLQSDLEYATLAEAMAQAQADLSELSKQYGPRHPKVTSAAGRAAGAKQKMLLRGEAITGLERDVLYTEIDMSLDGERAKLLSKLVSSVVERDGLTAQLAALEKELKAGQQRVKGLSDTALQLDSLNRDYKVAEAVFASALAKIDSSRADIFASYPMVQIAKPASLPDRPSSPNKIVAIAAGIAATLCLLIGLSLAWLRKPMIEWLIGGNKDKQHNPKMKEV